MTNPVEWQVAGFAGEFVYSLFTPGTAMKKAQSRKLCDCVENSLKQYFKDLNGKETSGVYQMVLTEMEKPLLAVVMKYAEKNQSKASRVLGINRNTLRKKLDLHGLND